MAFAHPPAPASHFLQYIRAIFKNTRIRRKRNICGSGLTSKRFLTTPVSMEIPSDGVGESRGSAAAAMITFSVLRRRRVMHGRARRAGCTICHFPILIIQNSLRSALVAQSIHLLLGQIAFHCVSELECGSRFAGAKEGRAKLVSQRNKQTPRHQKSFRRLSAQSKCETERN